MHASRVLRLACLLAVLGLLLTRHSLANGVSVSLRQDDEEQDGGANNNGTSTQDDDDDASIDGVKKEMLANGVASTLNRLGEVLDKMHAQVVNDEKVFKNFKKRVLDEEISKAEVDLSWPAIQDLVQSEVAVGRQKIRDQIAKFKLEVLDTVQKGLDALRADLRATITAGFISANASALGDDRSTLLVPPKRKPEGGEGETNLPNPDAEASKSQTTESTVETVTSALEGKLSPDDIAKLSGLIKDKLAAANQPVREKLDSYGEDALQALKEMEAALSGKLSDRDLKSEIWEHLQKLTKTHLQHPSPATKKALEDMRTIIVHALASKLDQGHTDAPTEAYDPEDKSVEAEKKRQEQRNKQRAKMNKGSFNPSSRSAEYDPMDEPPPSVVGPRPDYVRTVGSNFNATEARVLERVTEQAKKGDRPGVGPGELRFMSKSKLDVISQRLRELAARAAIRASHAKIRPIDLSDDS